MSTHEVDVKMPSLLGVLTIFDLCSLVLAAAVGAGMGWGATCIAARYCAGSELLHRFIAALTMAAVFVVLVLVHGITVQTLAYAILASILCAIALVDRATYTIPNKLVVVGAVVWATTVWFMRVPPKGFGPGTLFAETFGMGFLAVQVDGLVGGIAIGGGVLLFSLMFGAAVRRESLGGGDVKLLFVVGLYLGLALGLFALLLACAIAIVLALWSGVAGEQEPRTDTAKGDPPLVNPGESARFRTRVIPFGPAISAATVLALLAGPSCMEWYLGLLG